LEDIGINLKMILSVSEENKTGRCGLNSSHRGLGQETGSSEDDDKTLLP
jgi:hypothetical protein